MTKAETANCWQTALDTHLDALARGDADFEDTLALIERHFDYRPVSFRNGNLHNAAGSNEGSCRIFALARLAKLTPEQTLQCFGRHYRSVLAHPDGHDHANIRQFIADGGAGLEFSAPPLQPKPTSRAHMSARLHGNSKGEPNA